VNTASDLRNSFVAGWEKRVPFGGTNVANGRRADAVEAQLRSLFRSLLAAVVALVALGLPVMAQDLPAAPSLDTPWQEVISNQIRAFREHDAPGAFMYAGAGFQVSFPSAEAFFNAIVTSGYAPIMESVSHSFGAYRMLSPAVVIQEVRLVGKDQALYGAVYRLSEEEAGWRVQGVQLYRQQGVAI
jgi:hypothetical protein